MVEQAKSRLSQPVTGYGLAVVLLTCVSLFAMTLAVSIALTRSTERKFCSIVTGARQESQRRVDDYRKTPPTTEAGRTQQQGAGINLARWSGLERALGCPPDEKRIVP